MPQRIQNTTKMENVRQECNFIPDICRVRRNSNQPLNIKMKDIMIV